MLIILPLAPIAIAVVCIALGLFGEIQSNLNTINTVLIVLVAIVFSIIAIYNLTRPISSSKKVMSTLSCGVLGTVSGAALCYFIKALAEIEFGLLGLLEFAFVLMVGGGLTLLVILGCVMACCWFGD